MIWKDATPVKFHVNLRYMKRLEQKTIIYSGQMRFLHIWHPGQSHKSFKVYLAQFLVYWRSLKPTEGHSEWRIILTPPTALLKTKPRSCIPLTLSLLHVSGISINPDSFSWLSCSFRISLISKRQHVQQNANFTLLWCFVPMYLFQIKVNGVLTFLRWVTTHPFFLYK